jgi:hypothetical protein
VYYTADSISSNAGNSNLLPETSHNIKTQLSHNKNDLYFSFSLGYRNINDIIVETMQSSNGRVSSKYNNMGKAEKYISSINFSTTLFDYLDFDAYLELSYTNFKERIEHNGFSYYSELELYMPLFWDIDLDVSIVLYSKDILFNGYEEENLIIDEISISKSILNDNLTIGFSVWEPFFKSKSNEKVWDDTYTQTSNYEFVNSTCYMLNLSYVFDKGRNNKKISTKLNMEDNYNGK